MLKFDRQGLIPAVIQDDATGEVLMVAFMNEEALRLTRETGYTHFYSRSRHTIWRKCEQSGNAQEVRAIFVNCEENSLLIRVAQRGDAACHMGYRSCYYRRLLPDGSYETVAERTFDSAAVYGLSVELEARLRQLYAAYLYLRDHDLTQKSNTSRTLHGENDADSRPFANTRRYLASRLAYEMQELVDVQSGTHVHAGRQQDTILEGSQVGYWLLLLAAITQLQYDDFMPHTSILRGYDEQYSAEKLIELREQCLRLLTVEDRSMTAQGLQLGVTFIGWACAQAGVSPLAPVEFDLEQMRRKELVQ